MKNMKYYVEMMGEGVMISKRHEDLDKRLCLGEPALTFTCDDLADALELSHIALGKSEALRKIRTDVFIDVRRVYYPALEVISTEDKDHTASAV